MEPCILTVGTVTHAIHARRLLNADSIPARVIKTVRGVGGCVYGVKIHLSDLTAATAILRREGISFEWSRNENGGR